MSINSTYNIIIDVGYKRRKYMYIVKNINKGNITIYFKEHLFFYLIDRDPIKI